MIELINLTKKFDNFTAVDDLNLTIKDGEFFGLLGPNGAGKSTTISMISTVLLPTSGEIRMDGKPLNRGASAAKRKLAVVTQEYSLRQDMTIGEAMEYQGRLYFIPKKERLERSEKLLEFAGLLDFRHRIIRNLSGGMKRKLMVARALLTEPEFLMLDEPTTGMDAIARRQMWDMLRQLRLNGLTILLTTHNIVEAQSLCDRVAFINKGKLDICDKPKAMIDALGNYAIDETNNGVLSTSYFKDREDAISAMKNAGDDAVMRNTTLEDVFVSRYGNSNGLMGKMGRV